MTRSAAGSAHPTIPDVVAPSGRAGESAILSAALHVLGAKGFNGMSMRDVASSAGTSLSNLYNYFPSKADLVATLLTITNKDLLDRLEEAVDRADVSATARLTAAIDAYVGFNVERSIASLIGISEIRYLTGDRRRGVVQARDRTEQVFKGIIADGVETGEFATPYGNAASRSLVTMLAGMSLWYRPGGVLSRADLAQQQTRFGLAIVEAR